MSFSALEPDNLFSYTDIAKSLAVFLESEKTCETDSLRKSILHFFIERFKRTYTTTDAHQGFEQFYG